MIKTGHAWAGTFVTLDSTGALAAGSPAGALYVDGVANAATVTITGTNPYKWSVTLPTLTAGQRVDMYITATIATIATAGIVASEQADTVLLSDGVTLADDAITAASIKADAIDEIADGIWGADISGYGGGEAGSDLLYYQYNTYLDLMNGGRLDLLIDSIITHLTDIKGVGWLSNDSLHDIKLIATDASANAENSYYELDAIKGVGWSDETLVALGALLDAIKAKTDNLPADPADDSDIDAAIAAVKSVVDDILVDTGTTLDTLVKDIPTNAELATALGTADDAVLAALATTDGKVDSILEDTGTTLDTLIKDIPTNTELATALGTADDAVLAAVAAAKVVIDNIHDTDLPAVKAETALIVEDTGTTIPALLETIDNFLDTEVAAILEDTGTTLPATLATIAGYTDGIAGDVWSHPTRTLTNQGIDATSPASGDPLIIYRDTTVYISLTGLGDTSTAEKIFFTAKENLEDLDSDSIIQIVNIVGTPDTDTLLYINKAVPSDATKSTFEFGTSDDHAAGTAVVTIDVDNAANLPIYAATPLYWDVKQIVATTGVSTILSTGSMYIYGTPTRTIT